MTSCSGTKSLPAGGDDVQLVKVHVDKEAENVSKNDQQIKNIKHNNNLYSDKTHDDFQKFKSRV